MALKDVFKPLDDEQVVKRLENMDSKSLKEAFKQFLNMRSLHMVQLIVETAIKEDKDFLNSVSEEIAEMRKFLSLVDKYRGKGML